MIDWLRRSATEPSIALAGREMPIAIRRHARAKRMTLRLAPDGSEVRVTLPRWGRTADAMEFASRRRDWLEAQLVRIPRSSPPAPGGIVAFRGEELEIDWQPKALRRPERSGSAIRLGGPQETIARRLQRWLEQEALGLLEQDVALYCGRAGCEARPVRLSRAQRRWGSCAGDGTIRINWRLVQAPDHVRRSVVAHEVAHLRHFDHSAQFHALLDTIFEGDIRAANQWLKDHGRQLYAAFG
ncbi:MAG TPA: SprT family zinc-dependent metalloprotease [Sphingomonadaceae bacterium]|nr:SprT family zinc-dependent metalloprotease [Sphingomonadaceae bacterium]